MTRDQWARINALFHDGLAHPSSERVAWLARETSDPDVAREVLALIAAHESDGAFLESPAVAFGETTAAPLSPPLVGRLIGPYRWSGRFGPAAWRGQRPRYAARRGSPQGRQPRRHRFGRPALLQREARPRGRCASGIATVSAPRKTRRLLHETKLTGRTLRDG